MILAGADGWRARPRLSRGERSIRSQPRSDWGRRPPSTHVGCVSTRQSAARPARLARRCAVVHDGRAVRPRSFIREEPPNTALLRGQAVRVPRIGEHLKQRLVPQAFATTQLAGYFSHRNHHQSPRPFRQQHEVLPALSEDVAGNRAAVATCSRSAGSHGTSAVEMAVCRTTPSRTALASNLVTVPDGRPAGVDARRLTSRATRATMPVPPPHASNASTGMTLRNNQARVLQPERLRGRR